MSLPEKQLSGSIQLERRTVYCSEFRPLATAVELNRHAHFMRTSGSVGQLLDGQVIAVSKLDNIGFDSKGYNKCILVLCEHNASVPNATDQRTFVDI